MRKERKGFTESGDSYATLRSLSVFAVKKINMKLVSILMLVATVTVANSFGQKPSPNLKVIIIRHGEKPSTGDNLCPKGLDRANQLPAVLDKVAGIPDYTYIPQVNTGKTTRSVRMLQTITPFAVEHNLVLNTAFKNDDIKNVAADVLKKTGVVLMVWEHSNIPDIAKALGIKDKLKWKDEDYGSIWIIEFAKGLTAPTLRVEQENIKPKGECK